MGAEHFVVLIVAGIIMHLLYVAAKDGQQQHLLMTAIDHAHTIEAGQPASTASIVLII